MMTRTSRVCMCAKHTSAMAHMHMYKNKTCKYIRGKCYCEDKVTYVLAKLAQLPRVCAIGFLSCGLALRETMLRLSKFLGNFLPISDSSGGCWRQCARCGSNFELLNFRGKLCSVFVRRCDLCCRFAQLRLQQLIQRVCQRCEDMQRAIVIQCVLRCIYACGSIYICACLSRKHKYLNFLSVALQLGGSECVSAASRG